MKSVSGKRLAKLAEEHDWILARVNGGHHVYTKQGRIERLVIPIHGNQDLKMGTQRALMKIVPILESEL